ncbi:hypothetical protein KP509_01G123800 [Ceratopteris richardii]|uniref:Probable cytosolic iron-sulfur protein assembly protein CIAO1 homolog n=1 Tax=Ceratopteris richardii TaxID=49495 RepID=A0A8T2VL90_CERRI|nr:hypothetical protein KP509_01G123800 [Ceratopteris richardii]KAH7447849.1 hypothetical protein KP509_01G123800 [Ceratopteris richardii]
MEMDVVQELQGHSDRVWSVAWRPDSGISGRPSMLASCSGDKTVRIWQCSSSQDLFIQHWSCVAVLDGMHQRTVRSCEWSPDGKLLATASFDGTTAIWENVGGDFECVASLEGHENEVKSVSWNCSGTLLATCGRDKSVWIWELQPGNEFECTSVLHGHSQDVKMVLWHPCEDILVSASYDNSIKAWIEDKDREDWVCAQTLSDSWGHTSTVWTVSFDASGHRLVSCSDDLSLKIWDSHSNLLSEGNLWKHLCTISGYHDRTIFSVHWSKASGLIATGAGDDCIRIFSEESNEKSTLGGDLTYKMVLKKEKAHITDVNCVRWHPQEASLLASAGDDGVVKIWKVAGESLY